VFTRTFHVLSFVNEVITKKMSDALQLYYTLLTQYSVGPGASRINHGLTGHHSRTPTVTHPSAWQSAPPCAVRAMWRPSPTHRLRAMQQSAP